jgi:hypothetical protein
MYPLRKYGEKFWLNFRLQLGKIFLGSFGHYVVNWNQNFFYQYLESITLSSVNLLPIPLVRLPRPMYTFYLTYM